MLTVQRYLPDDRRRQALDRLSEYIEEMKNRHFNDRDFGIRLIFRQADEDLKLVKEVSTLIWIWVTCCVEELQSDQPGF